MHAKNISNYLSTLGYGALYYVVLLHSTLYPILSAYVHVCVYIHTYVCVYAVMCMFVRVCVFFLLRLWEFINKNVLRGSRRCRMIIYACAHVCFWVCVCVKVSLCVASYYTSCSANEIFNFHFCPCQKLK